MLNAFVDTELTDRGAGTLVSTLSALGGTCTVEAVMDAITDSAASDGAGTTARSEAIVLSL